MKWPDDDAVFARCYLASREKYLEHAGDRHMSKIEQIVEDCQSPIEAQLACHLARLELYGRDVHILGKRCPGQPFRDQFIADGLLCLEMQAQVGKYRADFLIHMVDIEDAPQKIVIECDGHDYHERTKEQAAHDRARDREMTAAGYHVFRFTGSEIHKNAGKCFDEITSLMSDLYMGGPKKAANG